MNRRKGFPRLAKHVGPFTDDHPVANMIRRGSFWFDAWVAQMGTPYAALSKKSGIAAARLFELSCGTPPTEAEIAALAPPWYVTQDGLLASIALSAEFTDRRQQGADLG